MKRKLFQTDTLIVGKKDPLWEAVKEERAELERNGLTKSPTAWKDGLQSWKQVPANTEVFINAQQALVAAEDACRDLLEKEDLSPEEEQDVLSFVTMLSIVQGPMPAPKVVKPSIRDQLKRFGERLEAAFPWVVFFREALLNYPYQIVWGTFVVLFICSLLLATFHQSLPLVLNYLPVFLLTAVLLIVVHVKDKSGKVEEKGKRFRTLLPVFLILISVWSAVGYFGQWPIGESPGTKLVVSRNGQIVRAINKSQSVVFYPTMYEWIREGQTVERFKPVALQHKYPVYSLKAGELTVGVVIAPEFSMEEDLIGENYFSLSKEQQVLADEVRTRIWEWCGSIKDKEKPTSLAQIIDEMRSKHFRVIIEEEPALSHEVTRSEPQPKEITERKSIPIE